MITLDLKTERLLIRELLPTDWEDLKSISEDFRKSAYADYDMPLPVADKEIKPLCQQFAKSGLWFAVQLDEIMIGYICFHDNNGEYDLGFCFHSDYHSKGYANESCTAVMDHIAKERKVKTFTAGTALKNKPSYKLLEKLGFVLRETEMLSFRKDAGGNDITFEGGIFEKRVLLYG